MAELETQLLLAQRIGYLSESEVTELQLMIDEVAANPEYRGSGAAPSPGEAFRLTPNPPTPNPYSVANILSFRLIFAVRRSSAR